MDLSKLTHASLPQFSTRSTCFHSEVEGLSARWQPSGMQFPWHSNTQQLQHRHSVSTDVGTKGEDAAGGSLNKRMQREKQHQGEYPA